MSIKVSSNLDTKNPSDVYATHIGNLTKGGVHSKASIAEMNAITVERRVRMMLCVVADTGTGNPGLYWLNTPPNPTTAQLANNTYWEIVPLGIALDGVLNLLGFENAGALTILDSVGSTGDTYIAEFGGSGTNPLIFGGASYNIQVGDYLVYEGNKWNVVGTGANTITWNTLTGKPTTFAPTPHTHTFPDITGLQAALDLKFDIGDVGDHGTDFSVVANAKLMDVYLAKQNFYQKLETYSQSEVYNKTELDALLATLGQYGGVITTESFTFAATPNTFTLSNAPNGVFAVTLRGVTLTPITDYTIAGSIITLLDTLTVGDEITISYYYDVNLVGSFYLKTEVDSLFTPTGTAYTKAESDAKYRTTAIAKSTNYTAVASDFILVTTGATDKTITLPSAAPNIDEVIEVKKVDNGIGKVIIDGDTAETIDGQLTIEIATQYTCLKLHSDGTNWHIK